MQKKVKEYVGKWQMLKKEDGVIVGVSGGADSVCLLFVLLELQKEIGFSMVAVHVNHRLRGEAADADESYVKDLCAQYGVPCETYSEDVELFAKKRKQSTEEAGREVRRMCFEQAMKKYNGNKIALAHHQNDSAETFLFHLARGTGLKGLGGISPVKGEIIRPLLCVSRKEIETYLKGQGISYCTDQTNASDVYTRNRVRNHVISYMEENINEKAVAHMNDTMEHLRQIQQYLEKQVQDAWEKVVVQREAGFLVLADSFQTMPEALKPLLIKKVLTDVAGREKDLASVHIRQLQDLFAKQSGRKTNLPYGIEGRRIYEGVLISKKHMGKDSETEERFCLEGDYGQFEWQGKVIQCRVLDKDKGDDIFVEKNNTERFDYDIIKNNISFRTRRQGDYITIHPDGRTQKLKAYFINEKIPQEKRNDVLLVADGSHIIWVVGYRVNPLYRIRANTKRILEIQIDEGEKNGRDY